MSDILDRLKKLKEQKKQKGINFAPLSSPIQTLSNMNEQAQSVVGNVLQGAYNFGADINKIRTGTIGQDTGVPQGFIGNQAQIFQNAGQNIQEASQRQASGQQGVMETSFQQVGQALPVVGKTATNIFSSALSTVLPEQVKQSAGEVGKQIAGTQVGQSVIGATQKVGEAYGNLSPRTKANIEPFLGAGEIALNVAPIPGAGMVGKGVGKGLENIGKLGKTGLKTGKNVLGKAKGIKLPNVPKLSQEYVPGVTEGGTSFTIEKTPGIIKNVTDPLFKKSNEVLAQQSVFPKATKEKTIGMRKEASETALKGIKQLYEDKAKGIVKSDISTMGGGVEGISEALTHHGGVIGELTKNTAIVNASDLVKPLKNSLKTPFSGVNPGMKNLVNTIVGEFEKVGNKANIQDIQSALSGIKSEIFSNKENIAKLYKTPTGKALNDFLKNLEDRFNLTIEKTSGNSLELKQAKAQYSILKKIEKDLTDSYMVELRNQGKGITGTAGKIAGLYEVLSNPSVSGILKGVALKQAGEVLQYYKSRSGNYETLIRNLDREALKRKSITNPIKNDGIIRPNSSNLDNSKSVKPKITKGKLVKETPKVEKVKPKVEKGKLVKKDITTSIQSLKDKSPESITKTLEKGLKVEGKTAQILKIVKEFIAKHGEKYIDKLADLIDEVATKVGAKINLLGGEKAKGIQVSQLEKAKALDRLGTDADKIWQSTGWEKGADGKWRFEIDDNNMAIKISDTDFKKGFDGKLNDLIDHTVLFKNYPELKSIKVIADKSLPKDVGANYNPNTNTITLNNLVRDRLDAFSDLLHEIQHSIQKVEGFPQGGSINSFKDIDIKQKRLSEIENIRLRAWDDLGEEYQRYGRILNLGEKNTLEYKEALIKMQSNPQKKLLWADYINALDDYRSIYKKGGLGIETALEQYKKLAGEVEARNVQKRLLDKDYKLVRPEKTEDIPRSQQILRKDTGVQNFMSDKGTGISGKIDDELIKEARKYKSFEEFKKGIQKEKTLLGNYLQKAQSASDVAKENYLFAKRTGSDIVKYKYYEKSNNIDKAIKKARELGIRVVKGIDNSYKEPLDVIYFELPEGQVSFHYPYFNELSKSKKIVENIDNYKWSGKTNSGEIIDKYLIKNSDKGFYILEKKIKQLGINTTHPLYDKKSADYYNKLLSDKYDYNQYLKKIYNQAHNK